MVSRLDYFLFDPFFFRVLFFHEQWPVIIIHRLFSRQKHRIVQTEVGEKIKNRATANDDNADLSDFNFRRGKKNGIEFAEKFKGKNENT